MANDTHRGGAGLASGEPTGLGATVAAIATQVSTLEGSTTTLDGQVTTLQGQVSTLQAGAVDLVEYAVGSVPDATAVSLGFAIWVTGTANGDVPAYSDGTNWLYYSDDATVAA